MFRVTDGAVDASLNDCLQVNTAELTDAEAEALGCAAVYEVGSGGGHDDHAAAGN